MSKKKEREPKKASHNLKKKSLDTGNKIKVSNEINSGGNPKNSSNANNKEKTVLNNVIYNFCTLSGKEYVFKVLALYYSLEEHSNNFRLWICCIDDDAYYVFTKMNLKNATILLLKDIEDKELIAIKESRKKNEYSWTLKSSLIKYVLCNKHVDSIIYCDGDLFFFSDPKAIFDEWGEHSVYLCPQRDLEWVHNMYGRYQAGLIGFKNDKYGMSCLNWWRNKCLEWCFSYPQIEMKRWGDQKYLDNIPLLFENIKISKNLGVDAAPWNTIYNNNYNIYTKNDDIYIESNKLVAYHFACISIFNESQYDLWTFMHLDIRKIIKTKIYLPYIESIRMAINKVKANINEEPDKYFCADDVRDAKTYFGYNPLSIEMFQYDDYYIFCTITSKEYLIKSLALYHSLKSKINNFHIWICCVDEITFSTLSKMQLQNATIMRVSEIEDKELKKIKGNRTTTEYCWTLKSPLVLYLLDKYMLNNVIYCDSDLFFFSNPKEIINEWKGYNTLMCTQRDNPRFERIHGRFQAGLLGFRNQKSSHDILKWWKQQCLQWCSDYPQPEMERWGDQKYLDKVPNLFVNIKIVNHLGIDAAPWNLIINNHYNVRKLNNDVYVKNNKLVVYHFGSMRIFNENEFDLWKLDTLHFSNAIIENIYAPYLQVIKAIIKLLKKKFNSNIEDFYSKDSKNYAKNLFKI
ncbi:glycosyl transferase [Candidatus Clostridium radicumherbarum]|uniref:Glycosyl transferase n=1 Tax=Candidatus Clostridium radicumherbarum TaxID=3381662 RepID=A0ABW8TLS7_9CLOT